MDNEQNKASRHPTHPSNFWTGQPSLSSNNETKHNGSDLVDKLRNVHLSDKEGEKDASEENSENTANMTGISSDTSDDIAIDRDILSEISKRIESLLGAIHALGTCQQRGQMWNAVHKEMDDEVQKLIGYVETMQGILEADLEEIEKLRHQNSTE